MPLVSKEVLVGVGGSNMRHFEALGYNIPRYLGRNKRYSVRNGTKILVKVEDLPLRSNAKVDVQCPVCKNVREISHDSFNINPDICHSCSAREIGRSKKGTQFPQIRGEYSPHWKNGAKSLQNTIRTSPLNSIWIQNVLKRDDYSCVCCAQRGGVLHVHHVANFSALLEMYEITKLNWREFKCVLFNVDNGITFCKKCHSEFHAFCGGNGQSTDRIQLKGFLTKPIFKKDK